ncbi:MAG: hypothetical protein U0325_11610 [Polyangiales bacterium]
MTPGATARGAAAFLAVLAVTGCAEGELDDAGLEKDVATEDLAPVDDAPVAFDAGPLDDAQLDPDVSSTSDVPDPADVPVTPVDAGGCANDSACRGDQRCCGGVCVDLQRDLAHCGSCGRACTVPTGTAVCASGVCAVGVCPAPLADCDGNPANGCECQRGMGDLPDDMFVDSDGDGIDGNAARAIFVSPRGDDSAPGTREAPKRTVQAGINAAAPMGNAVYVAAGMYMGTVTLSSGVSVYGGYSPTDWSRAATNVTTIQGGTTAVVAAGITARVELHLLTLVAADATSPGESSYGVRVAGSTGA